MRRAYGKNYWTNTDFAFPTSFYFLDVEEDIYLAFLIGHKYDAKAFSFAFVSFLVLAEGEIYNISGISAITAIQVDGSGLQQKRSLPNRLSLDLVRWMHKNRAGS